MKNYYHFSCLLVLALLTTAISASAQRTFSFSEEAAQKVDMKSINNLQQSTFSQLGKLDLSLTQISQKSSKAVGRNSQSSYVKELKESGVILERNQTVLVEIYAKGHTQDLKEIWQASGFKLVSSNHNQMVGWVPLAALPKLEGHPNIKSVRSVPRAHTDLGEGRNSGIEAMSVDLVRQNRLLDGKGVKIGILSSSYDLKGDATAGVLGGDLPGAGNPNGYTQPVVVVREGADDVFGPGNVDEARAMAEVIHDIAPAAELFIVGMPDGVTPLLIADAIQLLVDAGVDIIVDDLSGLRNDAFYQDGLASRKIDEVVDDLDIIYFTSAGNNGKGGREGRTRFYQSNFKPQNIFGGKMHKFVNIAPNSIDNVFLPLVYTSTDSLVRLTMQWDEPWGSLGSKSAQLDVRLVVLTGKGELGTIPVNVLGDAQVDLFGQIENNGGKIFIGIIAFGDLPGNIRLTIDTRNFDVADPGYNAPTVIGHKRAKRAIAVGAAGWFNTPRGAGTWNDVYASQIPNLVEADDRKSAILGFSGSPSVLFNTSDSTTYITNSSVGGSKILFDNNGNRLTNGQSRKNPWITGADGAETTFFSRYIPSIDQYLFFGSSCSSPAVAAIGALLFQASGNTMKPGQMRNLFKNTAEDMDDPYHKGFQEDPADPDFKTGYDLASGYGFVNAETTIEEYISTRNILNMNLKAICQNGNERKWRIRNNNKFAIEVQLSGRPIRLPGSSKFVNSPKYLLKPGNNFFFTESRYRVTSIRAEWFDKGLVKRTVLVTKRGSWPTCGGSNATATASNVNFEDNVLIFPNPSADGNFTIAIRTEVDEDANIELYDLSNKLIYQQKNQLSIGNNQFDLTVPEKKGIYILRISGKNSSITRRVVIQ